MFRFVTAILLFFLISLIPQSVNAQQFSTDAIVTYEIQESGLTRVHYKIEIENTTDSFLPKGYILKVFQSKPINIEAFEDNSPIFANITNSDTESHIELAFQNLVKGLGTKKSFEIFFDLESVAKNSGELWEIHIPKLVNKSDFKSYTQIVRVPLSFGDTAFIHPTTVETITDDYREYVFTNDQISVDGISATFGPHKVYSFDLQYTLQNSNFTFQKKSIALPPDTARQKIYLQEVAPLYASLQTDADGNWIATYNLAPKQTLIIQVKGYAQLFTNPRTLSVPKSLSILDNLGSTQYWQKDDPIIQQKASELATVENIYKYVVSTLEYNYAGAVPDRLRKGAVLAMKRPDDAICREFTDLFIALARAAGIPSREMNGFAFSDNPKVQPLSLVADVLHSWPEYWDSNRAMWVPVDPTWEHTTGGKDYFSSFDLNHVAFVIHGKSDSEPLPAGSYRTFENHEKNVFVQLTDSTPQEILETSITPEKLISIPLLSNTWKVTVHNNGNTALYNQELLVYFDSSVEKRIPISVLLPHSSFSFSISDTSSILSPQYPQIIRVSLSDEVIVVSEKRTLIVRTLLQLLFVVIFFLAVIALVYTIYRRRFSNYEPS